VTIIQLAKPRVDIGLSTNQLEAHLAFWKDCAKLPFEAELPISADQVQYRFDANGSVIKVNTFIDALPAGQRSGYREVLVAREDRAAPERLAAPDGARLTLVPPGFEGIAQIGIRMAVCNLSRHRAFFAECLGLPEEAPGRFRAGETLLILEQDATANPDASRSGPGWRYITLQVFKADEAHARALAHGATEARPPMILGDVARFSIIRDPDGNAIELSQRASLVGSLD
jgi:lactoylglutathione lyase